MTEEDEKELIELRKYRDIHQGKALNRAFSRLDNLLDSAHYDPVMSVRAFRVIAECLICLRDDINQKNNY